MNATIEDCLECIENNEKTLDYFIIQSLDQTCNVYSEGFLIATYDNWQELSETRNWL